MMVLLSQNKLEAWVCGFQHPPLQIQQHFLSRPTDALLASYLYTSGIQSVSQSFITVTDQLKVKTTQLYKGYNK